MEQHEFDALTEALKATLLEREEVLGLVALGSMARDGIEPDRWSDHDFFVVVPAGRDEQFRTDLSWIPDQAGIALTFRETEHGLKVLYTCGHLLEFAVFTPEQLSCARINRFRVLFERVPLQGALERLREACGAAVCSGAGIDQTQLGMFLCNLFVGIGRFMRGERLSAHLFVKSHALNHLLGVIRRAKGAATEGISDNIDPWRRFERLHPATAERVHSALEQSIPKAAREFLSLAAEAAGVGPGHSHALAFATVEHTLEKALQEHP